MAVFVLDTNKKPLMPCSEKRARLLLKRKRAVIHRMEPFTIRLKDRKRKHSTLQPQRLKLDPGSKITGFSVTREQGENESSVVLLGELKHKQGIKDSLDSRRSLRKNRRNRKTRYRKARFDNRKRCKGWLVPSLRARVTQTLNLIQKIRKLTPIDYFSMELVKFDLQKMQNPEISGIEYQQGELQGYEVREYLLEKFGRKCAYCHAEGIPLEVEHYVAKSRGGSDRISNLTIACRDCNEEKGNLLPEEWIERLTKSKKKIDKVRLENFKKVKSQLKQPLKDAAAVNSTRWFLYNQLKDLGVPVESGSGALTKMNRIQKQLEKEHFFDALSVGESGKKCITNKQNYYVIWSANGRGNRQMARVDKYGFPLHHLDDEKYDKNGKRKGHRERKKSCHDFQTGDIVVAEVTKGKKIGIYRGRVAIRHTGSFNIQDIYTNVTVQGTSYKYCINIQKNDGWSYQKQKLI